MALSACSIAHNYTESEKEMVSSMTPTKYQPATRQMRQNIETQDLLAQAAFWSREFQLNPADLESAVKLASAVRKMGNAHKAVEITQQTRAMFPNDPYLIAEHAASLIALERGDEAIKPLDSALRSAPGYARLWSLKGAALDQGEKYDLARKHYSRALQLTPHDPNIMANMGLSFALAGDAATAEQWLRRAASHPDASDNIQQNLDLVMQLQGKTVAPRPMAQAPQRSAPAPTRRTAQRQAPRHQMPTQRHAAAPQMPAGNAPVFGHRSNMTVVGDQSGGPKSAAEMARAVASNSGSNRVVVPHGAGAPGQANILDQIGQSVAQKRNPAPGAAYQPQRQYPNQMQAPQGQPAASGYPQPGPQPTRRGAARRR